MAQIPVGFAMNESIYSTANTDDLFDLRCHSVRGAYFICVISDHFSTTSKPVVLRRDCRFLRQFLEENQEKHDKTLIFETTTFKLAN